MEEVNLIFPNQLFEESPLLVNGFDNYLWESNLHFTHYKFHKKKLLLHRASMKFYEDHLNSKNINVNYLEVSEYPKLKNIFKLLIDKNIEKINTYDPVDYLLERRLKRYSEEYNININYLNNPNFLSNQSDLKELFTEKRYYLTKFYIKQRKRFNILTEGDSPVGGKWSYDAENRKKLPKDHITPIIPNIPKNKYILEATDYANKHFPNNYGDTNNFNYPITFNDAEDSFINFLEKRMNLFGDYEDAIAKNEEFIYHSILTPALNIGLINPDKIIKLTLEYHNKYNYPLNSLEGFIRQVIGWREFMMGIYKRESVKIRTTNYYNFNNKLPNAFYTSETGIAPLDDTIKKVLKNAYNHHIERLMVIGNFMVLCEIDPDEIYKWFMELYIDAYDWVMVPNVYSMSQYSDGGLVTTKPYISGSNYIRKMSDYKKGDWCEIWDSLYWRFIHKYQDKFAKNPRMSMMINLVNKKSSEDIDNYYKTAENYLSKLHK